jgi:hypothetical protein
VPLSSRVPRREDAHVIVDELRCSSSPHRRAPASELSFGDDDRRRSAVVVPEFESPRSDDVEGRRHIGSVGHSSTSRCAVSRPPIVDAKGCPLSVCECKPRPPRHLTRAPPSLDAFNRVPASIDRSQDVQSGRPAAPIDEQCIRGITASFVEGEVGLSVSRWCGGASKVTKPVAARECRQSECQRRASIHLKDDSAVRRVLRRLWAHEEGAR